MMSNNLRSADMSVLNRIITSVFIFLCMTDWSRAGAGAGVPCVYEGHLKTDKNWYGYLANISVITTGRMTFQFSYQAERCCQNILFYSENQVSIINARMNCWQKEYLLRPEDDQILRLTPRFSWSGCHVTNPNGVATYICEGGRSFTVDQPASGPTTWYVAVSNCATLQGLDLQYRLVVYGHIGECRSGTRNTGLGSPTSGAAVANPRSVLMPKNMDPVTSSDSLCIIKGKLNESSSWYGFLSNVSFARGGGVRFQFTYPTTRKVQYILLYTEEDVGKLTYEQTCWQKEGVILESKRQEQVLDLSRRSSWNGCVSREGTTPSDTQLVCQGERWYDEPRKIYLAVSNCLSHNGLILQYYLEIYRFTNNICSCGVGILELSLQQQYMVLLIAVSFFSFLVAHFPLLSWVQFEQSSRKIL